MKNLKGSKKLIVLVMLVLILIPVSTALAWWSGWYSPNFNGSYSPSSYRHGQWNSSWYNTEVFGSQMQWNSSRQQGVFSYSHNRRWIWYCGNCYAYYTHDHTDMNNKLSARGYATNFYSPIIDADDDNHNGRLEELEVTSVNWNFPPTYNTRYLYSYFTKHSSGSGVLRETPQVSARNMWSGEYDAYRFDGYPQSLSYWTYGYQEDNEDKISQIGTPFTRTVISEQQFPVHIFGNVSGSTLSISLEYPMQSNADLATYVQWAKEYPTNQLEAAGVTYALTVITFKQPLSTYQLDTLLNASDSSPVIGIKATYLDTNDPNPETNKWTLGILELGNDYMSDLAGLVADVTSNHLDENEEISLELEGIVSVTAWLPLDIVDALNNNALVYLADATPSYLRLVASETEESQSIHQSLADPEFEADGFWNFLQPIYNDVLPYMELFVARGRF